MHSIDTKKKYITNTNNILIGIDTCINGDHNTELIQNNNTVLIQTIFKSVMIYE